MLRRVERVESRWVAGRSRAIRVIYSGLRRSRGTLASAKPVTIVGVRILPMKEEP